MAIRQVWGMGGEDLTLLEEIALKQILGIDSDQVGSGRDEFFTSPLIPYLNQRPNILQQAAEYWGPQLERSLGPGLQETLAGNYRRPTAQDIWEDPFLNALMPENIGVAGTYIGMNAARKLGLPEVGATSLQARKELLKNAGVEVRDYPLGHMIMPDGSGLSPFSSRGISNHWETAIDAGYLPVSELENLTHSPNEIVNGMLKEGWIRDTGRGKFGYEVWNPNSKTLRNLEKSIEEKITNYSRPNETIYVDDTAKGLSYEFTVQNFLDNDSSIRKTLENASRSKFSPGTALEFSSETYPVGTFSSLYDRTPMVEIPDNLMRLRELPETPGPLYDSVNHPILKSAYPLGEIQARDTASRMNLNALQRTVDQPLHPLAGTGGLAPDARWSPLSTENIPIVDAILRYLNK